MVNYVGKRKRMFECEVYVYAEGIAVRLRPRLDLWSHSPTGFEWGYGGSGPAQLALAILAHCLGDDQRALLLHQEFKRVAVIELPREGWTLSREEVLEAVAGIEKRREKFAPVV